MMHHMSAARSVNLYGMNSGRRRARRAYALVCCVIAG